MQSQEFGAHYPIFWLSFSAPVERRTSQYESEKTYCHLETAGAIQKDGCWTWPVYGLPHADNAEHDFDTRLCR